MECGIYRCRTSDKIEIPTAPSRKNPTIVSVAFLGLMPPVMRYFFDDGNMLNKDENICDLSAGTYHV